MWAVIEIGVNLFQAWLMIFFMKHRLHLKDKHLIQEICCITGITIFLSLYYFCTPSFPDTFVFLFPLVFALTSSKDPWYVSMFWGCILAVLFLTTVSIIFNIFVVFPNISFALLMGQTKMRLLVLFVTNGTLFLLIWTTKFLRKKYTMNYWPSLIVFMFSVIVLFLIEETVYSLQESSPDISGNYMLYVQAYIGVLMGVFFIVILFHNMSRSMENENRYKMEIATIEKTRRYTADLEMLYTRLIEMKHDLKHHYQLIENLVSQGKKDEADIYVRQSQEELEQSQYRWTGSYAIDALIFAKYMGMRQNHIRYKFDPYPLSCIPIPETDFCTILGNILDNAIEGICRAGNIKEEERIIQLSISRSKDMLYLYCTNPCDEDSINVNPNGWISSKPVRKQAEYGVGIRSVQHIVEGADGRCDFSVDNNVFSVRVVLPYQNGVDDR